MGRLAEMQRKHLEQLMGPEAMGVVPQDIKFWDPKVCRNFLCGTCPHELFTNTRMDLGPCPKSHTDRLRDEYKAALENPSSAPISKADLIGLQSEYERSILAFVEDCDRRIRAAQRRLEKTPEENNKTTSLMREIGEIQTAYDLAMQEVEQLGETGKIEESMAELAKAEALKAEKQDKERELQALTETAGASGHQKLRVCDICGAYLSVLDSDRRLADHFGGKMHLGYLTLRQTIEEWRARGPLTVASLSKGGPATPSAPRTSNMGPPSLPNDATTGLPVEPPLGPRGATNGRDKEKEQHHSSSSASSRRHGEDSSRRHHGDDHRSSDRDRRGSSRRERDDDDRDSRGDRDKRRRMD